MSAHLNDPKTVAEATGCLIGQSLLNALLNVTEGGPHPVSLLSDAMKDVCVSQSNDELQSLAFDGLSVALYAVLMEGVTAIKAKSE